MRRLSKLRSGNSHFVKRTEHFFRPEIFGQESDEPYHRLEYSQTAHRKHKNGSKAPAAYRMTPNVINARGKNIPEVPRRVVKKQLTAEGRVKGVIKSCFRGSTPADNGKDHQQQVGAKVPRQPVKLSVRSYLPRNGAAVRRPFGHILTALQ